MVSAPNTQNTDIVYDYAIDFYSALMTKETVDNVYQWPIWEGSLIDVRYFNRRYASTTITFQWRDSFSSKCGIDYIDSHKLLSSEYYLYGLAGRTGSSESYTITFRLDNGNTSIYGAFVIWKKPTEVPLSDLIMRSGSTDKSSTPVLTLYDNYVTESPGGTIIDVSNTANVHITNLKDAAPAGVVSSYTYWLTAESGEDIFANGAYGLAYEANSSISGDLDLTGVLSVDTGAAEYVDIPLKIRRTSTSQNSQYKSFILRVHRLTEISFTVGYEITQQFSERYPFTLSVNDDITTYSSKTATSESQTYTLATDVAFIDLSLNMINLEVGDNGYSVFDGNTYTTSALPLRITRWRFTKDSYTEYYTPGNTIPMSVSLNGGTFTAELAPAMRVHYRVNPLRIDEQTIIQPILSGNDQYIITITSPDGMIYTMPEMGTSLRGYNIINWAYKDIFSVLHITEPKSRVRVWADTQTSMKNGNTIYGNMLTLIGDAALAITDDVPYAIVFDPAGGTFDPSYEVTAQAYVGSTAIQSEIFFDFIKKVWVWWSDDPRALEATDMTVSLENVPLMTTQGLTPPAGIDHAYAWTIAAPYFISADDSQNFTIPLSRSTTEGICQKTAYPVWVPSRIDDKQRAVLTAPGYGTIDLGNIQSVADTYTSKVIQIPIVVYGYTGAFCMDLGVQREMSINYIRTMPTIVNDDSGDSRDWSNAKWIEALKNVMNRWQMRTDGNKLYLLRPRVIEGVIEQDPMNPYYEEYDGVNCYITSLPVKYESTPHSLSGSVELSIGTLYPHQPELTPYILHYVDAQGNITVIKHAGKFLCLPDPLDLWNGSSISAVLVNGVWTFSGVAYLNWVDANDVTHDFGTVVDLSGLGTPGTTPIIFRASSNSLTGQGCILFCDGLTDVQHTITITKTSSAVSANVFLGAIGGGGGGGSGRRTTMDVYNQITGGGGGASGRQFNKTLTLPYGNSNTIVLNAVCGHKGKGGATYTDNGAELGGVDAAGSQGGTSYISLDNTRLIEAAGGGGGEIGSKHWDSGIIAYGGGNPLNEKPGGTVGERRGGNGGTIGSENAGNGQSWGNAPVAGKGGIGAVYDPSLENVKVCGGGGGGGGFYLNGMEEYSVGVGGIGVGGNHDEEYPYGTHLLQAQNGGYGAGGGGGGGRISRPLNYQSNVTPYPLDGGDGGGGWIFVCVLSGGTVTWS